MAKTTSAARLDSILEKVAPKAAAHHKATGGAWPERPGEEGPERYERETAPGVWTTDKALAAKDVNDDPKKGDPVRRRYFGKAPYEITDTADGGRRVRVFADDGSVSVGNGPSTEAAVADLEKKLGLAQAKG